MNCLFGVNQGLTERYSEFEGLVLYINNGMSDDRATTLHPMNSRNVTRNI